MDNSTIYSIIYSIIGGLAINLWRYIELCRSDNEQEKEFARHKVYWIQFIFSPILGGILTSAYINSGVQLNAILAIQIGASSPLILKSLASSVPQMKVENAA